MKNYLKKFLVFFALISFGLGLGMQTIYANEIITKFGGSFESPFSKRRPHPTLPGVVRGHDGIDIGVVIGTKVPSAGNGIVRNAEWMSGYGYTVIIDLDDGSSTLYAHLSEILVSVGQRVKKWEVVALSGNTGDSDGPHLHAEYHPNGWRGPIDPYPFYTNVGWIIDGSYIPEGGFNSPDDGVFGNLRKIIPKIDFDYTTYFSPSERLLEATHKIIETIKNSFDRWQPAILNLLYSLMLIDLAWFACQCTLKGELPFTELFPKIIRYGFFITLAKEWKKIIDNMFIPFFENISSTMTGNEHTVETFLNFSTLYDTVKHIMSNNMHPEVNLVEAWYQMFPFIILNILNWVILFIIIGLMLWVMYKVVAFYMVCSFGILGIPINFIPKIGNRGNMMMGVIISTLFDLILTAILLNLLNSQLQTLGIISANNVPDVFMFVGVFFFLALFTTKLSEACSNFFSGLL